MKDFLQEISILITLLFKGELNRKQASWIFKKAVKCIPKEYYMCIALQYFTCRIGVIPIRKLEKFGFTRENYHKFINDHYPELTSKLIPAERGCCWIVMGRDFNKVIKSKQEFLMQLSTLNFKS